MSNDEGRNTFDVMVVPPLFFCRRINELMSVLWSERGLCLTLISAKEGIGAWLRQNIEIIWEQPKTQENTFYFLDKISINLIVKTLGLTSAASESTMRLMSGSVTENN